jgi:hypothetical protein
LHLTLAARARWEAWPNGPPVCASARLAPSRR